MSFPVVLKPAAKAEFDGAFDGYEQQRAGLGVDFVARTQEVFERIGLMPLAHAVVFQDVRRANVRKFPCNRSLPPLRRGGWGGGNSAMTDYIRS